MMSKISESFKDFSSRKNRQLTQQGFPTTRYPVPVKKNLDLMVDWTIDNENVGYGLAKCHEAHGDCLIHMQSTFNRILRVSKHTYLVPKQTVVLSLAFAEFSVGKGPQEFVLTEKREMPEGAFFSYKKLSKYVQATYYNEGGVEYLAGVSYYPPLKGFKFVEPGFDETVLSMEVKRCLLYRNVEERFERREWKYCKTYNRYCSTAKKRVIVKVYEGKEPAHFDYNYLRRGSFTTPCAECAQEFKTFKAAQATKKLSAPVSSPVKPAASRTASFVAVQHVPVVVPKTVETDPMDVMEVAEVKKAEVETVVEQIVDSDEEDYDFGN